MMEIIDIDTTVTEFRTGNRVSVPVDDARTLLDALCVQIGDTTLSGLDGIDEYWGALRRLNLQVQALAHLLEGMDWSDAALSRHMARAGLVPTEK